METLAASAELFRRSEHAHRAIYAVNRRPDSRAIAVSLVLLLHRLAPPVSAKRLRRSWYRAGAVARMHPRDIIDRWSEVSERHAPCEKTIRRHLDRLHRAGIVICAPGDPHPWGRFPDTLHLCRSPAETRWWLKCGLPRLKRSPRARVSRAAWRAVIGGWREAMRSVYRRLKDARARARSRPTSDAPGRLEALRDGALGGSRETIVAALRACGIKFSSGWKFRIWKSRERLSGCLALLAERARSVGWPRDPAAWIAWAFKSGAGDPPAALARLRKTEEPVPLADLGIDLGAFRVPGPKGMTELERFQERMRGI